MPVTPPLTLKIVLTKPSFFEGEPIYGLFGLRNVSADTVRIPPYSFNTSWLVGVLRRADGSVVAGGRSAWVDYLCRETCNGDPVAPGGVRYFPFVLQEYWGEVGPLSHAKQYHDLKTGSYALEGSFRLDGPEGSTPFVASRVALRIRRRRPAEDTAYQQFVRLGAVDVRSWTVGVLDSALAWTSGRLAVDSADPFALQILIWSEPGTRAMRPGVETPELVRIFELELAIVETQPTSPVGALAVEYLYGGGPPKFRDPRLPLCPTLVGTLAGDIACEREARFARN